MHLKSSGHKQGQADPGLGVLALGMACQTHIFAKVHLVKSCNQTSERVPSVGEHFFSVSSHNAIIQIQVF